MTRYLNSEELAKLNSRRSLRPIPKGRTTIEIRQVKGHTPIAPASFKFTKQWDAQKRKAVENEWKYMPWVLKKVILEKLNADKVNVMGHRIKGHDDGDGFVRFLDNIDANFAAERKGYHAQGSEHIDPQDRCLLEGEPTEWCIEVAQRAKLMQLAGRNQRALTDKPFEWVLERCADVTQMRDNYPG